MAEEVGKRGDVLLVEFPFTDHSGSKVRPAIVVMADKYIEDSEDILCVYVSSVVPVSLLPTDIIIDVAIPEFGMTGLKRTSVLRSHKLALIHREKLFERLGTLSPALMRTMEGCLADVLGFAEHL